MKKLKEKREADFRFEEVEFVCKCGNRKREIIPVANNTGVLDVKCKKCGYRNLEIRIFEDVS